MWQQALSWSAFASRDHLCPAAGQMQQLLADLIAEDFSLWRVFASLGFFFFCSWRRPETAVAEQTSVHPTTHSAFSFPVDVSATRSTLEFTAAANIHLSSNACNLIYTLPLSFSIFTLFWRQHCVDYTFICYQASGGPLLIIPAWLTFFTFLLLQSNK